MQNDQTMPEKQSMPETDRQDIKHESGFTHKLVHISPYALLFLVLVTLVVVSLQFKPGSPETVPGPLPTSTLAPIPTQRPGRSIAAVATLSAFFSLEGEAQILGDLLSSVQIIDAQLTPPLVVLPIGL